MNGTSIGPGTSARPRGPQGGSRLRSVVVGLLLLWLLEILLLVALARAIGAWPTILLLVAGTLLGGWLVAREWRRAGGALRQSLRSGRLPHESLVDGMVVLVGGLLILLPGLVTDVLGFLAVLPATRPLVRSVLARSLGRAEAGRLMTVVGPAGGATLGTSSPGTAGPWPGTAGHPAGATRSSADEDDVIEGEIL